MRGLICLLRRDWIFLPAASRSARALSARLAASSSDSPATGLAASAMANEASRSSATALSRSMFASE